MSQSYRHFITKIPQIIEGWKNLVIPNSRVEALAVKRLQICFTCPENSTPNEIKLSSTCKSCGCVLEAKSRSVASQCPKNKWPNLDQI